MINPFERPVPGRCSIDDVLYWVWEREMIRMSKVAGREAPYTHDPILSKYRFCNVRRRDDRVSQWIINNLLDDYRLGGENDMWFVAAIARYVNWPPSLRELLAESAIPERAEDFDPDLFIRVMDGIKDSGQKVWGSAFMLYPGRETGSSKSETVARRFLLPLANEAARVRESLAENRVEALVKCLTTFWGWNTFMAGQVAADLTYYPQELGEAIDLYSWAPIGPGSSRGLARLAGVKLSQRWFQEDFNRRLIDVWTEIQEQIELDHFTLHDAQNCMCEMDKYWRTLNNEGSPRSIYKPETAY